MLGNDVARPAVVDTYKIVTTAARKAADVAIEQHDRNTGPVECSGDALVDLVLLLCKLHRREEDTVYPALDVVLA